MHQYEQPDDTIKLANEWKKVLVWRFFSRLYILLSVQLYVCNTVHCGSQGQCTGLKVVPACS